MIFVALQIQQNTRALERTEHNSTMAQWTVIRMAIAQNRDIAELMTTGLHGERALDAADQLRLEQMLQENAWAAFHIWDRTQRGIFPKGTFEATGGALLDGPTENGWWRRRGGVARNTLASLQGLSPTSMRCSREKGWRRGECGNDLGLVRRLRMRKPLIRVFLLVLIPSLLWARDSREQARIEYLLQTVESLKGAAFI